MTEDRSSDQAPEQLFEQLLARFLTNPQVSEGRMFGSPGLKVAGKVFAMLVRGELVVKISRERVDQVVASGRGAPFNPGHGKLMKEWVAIPSRSRP